MLTVLARSSSRQGSECLLGAQGCSTSTTLLANLDGSCVYQPTLQEEKGGAGVYSMDDRVLWETVAPGQHPGFNGCFVCVWCHTCLTCNDKLVQSNRHSARLEAG